MGTSKQNATSSSQLRSSKKNILDLNPAGSHPLLQKGALACRHRHSAEGALSDAGGAVGRAQHVAAVEPSVHLALHAHLAH
jgi:hypothetical protein